MAEREGDPESPALKSKVRMGTNGVSMSETRKESRKDHPHRMQKKGGC